jgi:hypothetical protein
LPGQASLSQLSLQQAQRNEEDRVSSAWYQLLFRDVFVPAIGCRRRSALLSLAPDRLE